MGVVREIGLSGEHAGVAKLSDAFEAYKGGGIDGGQRGLPDAQREHACSRGNRQRVNNAVSGRPPVRLGRESSVASNFLSVPIEVVDVVDGWNEDGEVVGSGGVRVVDGNVAAVPGESGVGGVSLRAPCA